MGRLQGIRAITSKAEINKVVRLNPPDYNDPLSQASGSPHGNVSFSNYMKWQSRQNLDYASEVGKAVETQHASMASTTQKESGLAILN